MMDLAYGSPLDPLGMDLAMGKAPIWRKRWSRGVAVAEIFPPGPGSLAAIHGLSQVKRLTTFHRLRQRIPTGEPVGWARDGFRCPLFVVLCHSDPNLVRMEAELLPRLVRMEVE